MTNMDTQLRFGDTSKRSYMAKVARVLAIVTTAVVLAGCLGYVPGEKANWDQKIKEMCEKEGGVRILERVHISRSELALLGRSNGRITVLTNLHAHPKAPVYAESQIISIRDKNPSVWRSDSVVITRANNSVVARWTSYVRVGGDFPTHAQPSSYTCPNPDRILAELQELFIVEGASK